MKLQAVRAGDLLDGGRGAVGERDRQRHLAVSSPPDRRLAAVRFLYICRCVVAPAHRDGQVAARLGHEKTHAYRRWEECLTRRLALVVRLLGQTGRLGDGVEVVVLIGIGALVGGRSGRNQKSGDVPVRRALAARQLLGAEFMTRPRSDQIELQGLDEAQTDLKGVGGGTFSVGRGPAGTLHG